MIFLHCIFSLLFITVGFSDTVNSGFTSASLNTQSKLSENGNVLIVSTIDGEISAFKTLDGKKLWSIDTQPGNLFSSSLTELEVLFRGQQIQLIPSLDGRLYKFDGKTIEAIPVSVEMLLSTSYKIGDNLNIVGGKDIQSYGINLSTGELQYVCASDGCKQLLDSNETVDVLVIERHSHTVRAVNFRNGDEQWSYRVGEHRITLSKGCKEKITNSQNVLTHGKDYFCSQNEENEQKMSSVKVAMMKGLIGIIDHSSNLYRWTQKLSSPIVDVWHLNEGSVVPLDLFEIAGFSSKNMQRQSLLLVGVYNKKLYIKQSSRKDMSTDIDYVRPTYSTNLSYYIPVVPDNSTEIPSSSKTTSLMLKYPETDHENGIFFAENNPQESNATHCFAKRMGKLSSFKQSVFAFIYKWKDALIATAICSIITNLICYCIWKYIVQQNNVADPLQTVYQSCPDKNLIHSEEAKTKQMTKKLSISPVEMQIVNPVPPPAFHSRYFDDFDFIECLGKGGYGVVFKVKNKIDCCEYAVKRIKFSKDHAFDRVKREVKVLAKLDHSGIVRYYNAWVETPPVEWENAYNQNCGDDFFSSSVYSSTSNTPSRVNHDLFNPLKPFENDVSEAGISNYDISTSLSSQIMFERSPRTSLRNNELSQEGDSDIVFKDFSSDNNVKSSLPSISKSSLPATSKSVKYLFIQMQLCRRESLKDWLTTNCTHRELTEVLDIFYQIVSAVEYVHEQGLIHRDMKPSNIFFSLDGTIKIGDFGLVSSEHEDCTSEVKQQSQSKPFNKHTDDIGTKLYMSPEMVLGLDYNHKVDIFSLGLIFYELLVPFQTQFERVKVLTDIKLRKFPQSFQKDYETEYKLVNKLLMKNPDNRPSADEIREDSLFDIIRRKECNISKNSRARTLSTSSKKSSIED